MRGEFDSWPVFWCFRKLKKMAISIKTMFLLPFLLVLSEVAKTFIASRRGKTHNSHKLQVRVERVVYVVSLLDNPFIHGILNTSSCFRCTAGYPSFRIQTIISVIYLPKDLFLLPIKSGFDGSKSSLLRPTTFNFIQHNIYCERVLLAETRKTAFANFPFYQRDVLGWGDLKKRGI